VKNEWEQTFSKNTASEKLTGSTSSQEKKKRRKKQGEGEIRTKQEKAEPDHLTANRELQPQTKCTNRWD